MAFGLDCVTVPPIADMKAAGVSFVGRYLSYINNLTQVKLLTPPEAKALSEAGISIVSNYEWYASRATEGFTAGRADAQIAATQHAECGGPGDRPIYFSVDIDTSGSFVAAYFQGVISAIGRARTGAYGSYRVIGDLFNAGLISWGWQTYAWSGGQWEPRAHIQQYLNGVSMSGHSVDYDRSIKSDYGQWQVGGTFMIDITTPGVSRYYTQTAPGVWLSTHTKTADGKPIYLHGAILDAYCRFGNSYLCGLTWLGLVLSNEIPLPGSTHGAVKVYCENGVLFYDPAHEFDTRPGLLATESVYLAHLYSGFGQDPKIAELQNQLGGLQNQLVADEAQVTQLQAELAHATQATGLDPVKVTERLQTIGLASHNGDAAIQQLVTQSIT